MALTKEYFNLTNKYINDYGEKTILLMQVGSFFEVYGKKIDGLITGSRIIDFSQLCELNIVDKNICAGDTNIVMAGFKDIMIEKYIKKIQDGGFTAVVYVQDECAKGTTRSCAGIYSPGTYFGNENNERLTNNLTCIWIEVIQNSVLVKGKYIVIGIANIDIYTGQTHIFQYKENYIKNPTTYDELERFISIYNPSEVILIANVALSEIEDIINYSNIQCSLIHKISTLTCNEQQLKRIKNCEKQNYQHEILSKFFKDVFFDNFYNNDIATQAYCYLLDFVYQHNPYLVSKISEPVFENVSERMILANHSLKQLNIIDDHNYSGKYSCILKMLNNCLTPMGRRQFSYQFLNPITNETTLQIEYDIIEYLLNCYDKYNFDLKNGLSNIKDLAKWERQIILKKITPKSFYQLYKNLQTIIELYNLIRNDKTIMNYLDFFENNIFEIKEYCITIYNFIEKTIIIDIAKDIDQTQQFDTNFIKKGVDNELDIKTNLLKTSELKLNSICEYFSSVIYNLGGGNNRKIKTDSNELVKIHETEKNNLSILCTSRRCELLRNGLPREQSIVPLKYTDENGKEEIFNFLISKSLFNFEKQSASNNSISDGQINELCKSISSVKISLKDIITRVYSNFIEQFEQFQSKIDSIIYFVSLLDILYTKTTLAKTYNYCKPTIDLTAPKSFIRAKKLRHCLIERIQQNEIYVTNDISIGERNIEHNNNNCEKDGYLLYGTNAVGKTSFIKALGISLIMAQAGLFVPCSEFYYKPYKYLFTRILGNDNIFKGLSTFAVEMSELRTILRLADENSLILGDELCSGTEISSAISIFVAGIQQLNTKKSSYIFATHLHDIVDYDEIKAMNRLSLKHMSVIYNKEQDCLIYDRKLKDGPGNSMYGLEVCKSLNLPQDFLDNAYAIREKYNPDSRSILSLKTSHYNSQKIVGLCEQCEERMGTEVHHLIHQKQSNEDGTIETDDLIFHKNNKANLMTLCEKCHQNTHQLERKEGIKGNKKVKTNNGKTILQNI